MTNFVSCIFCHEHCDNLAALKDHSANCPKHPAVIESVKFQTMRHIELVRNLLNEVVIELLDRARLHDQSKLEPPEAEMFAEFTRKLYGLTYGSPEYEACRKELGVALQHHYEHNRHHPEHHEGGIEGMDLIDLIEMFCDWRAATMRHHDGDIRVSIVKNAERFKMAPQLATIFQNTVPFFE